MKSGFIELPDQIIKADLILRVDKDKWKNDHWTVYVVNIICKDTPDIRYKFSANHSFELRNCEERRDELYKNICEQLLDK